MSLREVALTYAKRGWRVVPLNPQSKVPNLPNWPSEASTDPSVINDWFPPGTNRNIAILCGPKSNLLVLDVDCKNGQRGLESLQQLEDQHGDIFTRTVESPSGGCHLYFEYPANINITPSNIEILPGIDLKVAGGVVAAPPSIINGKSYECTNDVDPVPCPDWLLELLNDKFAKNNYSCESLSAMAGFTQGGRNSGVFRKACGYRGNGLSKDEAQQLILEEARKCTPPLSQEEALACLESAWKYPTSYPRNDVGNAERFVSLFNDDIRYATHTGKWLIREGSLWRTDSDGQIVRFAVEAVESMGAEAMNEEDQARRTLLLKHEKASGSLQHINSMISLAQSNEGISVAPEKIDADSYLLGTRNGVLDLHTQRLIDTDQIVTKRVPVWFDPDAKCPRWERFLQEVFDGHPEIVGYVQRAVGYSLTGETDEQCLFFLHGQGANGKSTFLNVIKRLFGEYAVVAPSHLLMASKSPDYAAIARMHGARLVIASEVPQNAQFDEVLIKQLTGNDTLTARHLYQGYFEFSPTFALWLAGNHKPKIQGTDYAIWRRIKLIPFTRTFIGNEQDHQLEQRLTAELPGILNWALGGCVLWSEEGLVEPESISEATKEYRSDEDILGIYIAESCDCDPNFKINAKPLYDDYKKWAKEAGERVMTSTMFGKQMVERGFQKIKTSGLMVYSGIKLPMSATSGWVDL